MIGIYHHVKNVIKCRLNNSNSILLKYINLELKTMLFYLFLYKSSGSKGGEWCMPTAVNNICQFPVISAFALENGFPKMGVDDDTDGGEDPDNRNLSTIVSLLVLNGKWLREDGEMILPQYGNIIDYLRQYDSNQKNEFNDAIQRCNSLLMCWNVKRDGYEDRRHFTTMRRFGNWWVWLGGEKSCWIGKISHSQIVDFFFTNIGRGKLRTKAQIPFGEEEEAFVDYVYDANNQPTQYVFLPIRDTNNVQHNGGIKLTTSNVGWTQAQTTSSNFSKDHSFMLCNIENLPILSLENASVEN